jgi:hypothetical protein
MYRWLTIIAWRAGSLSFSPSSAAPAQATADESEDKGTIASYLNKQLGEEFKNEELASQTKTDLNETLSKEKVCASACAPCLHPSVQAEQSTLPMQSTAEAESMRIVAGVVPRAGGEGEQVHQA